MTPNAHAPVVLRSCPGAATGTGALPFGVRFAITEVGRRALEAEPEELEVPSCDFCFEAFQPGESIIAAGAGRHLHDTPSCRGAFESFIHLEEMC